MERYLMMIYVSLDQERAMKKLFLDNGWKYQKPDLLKLTDQLGPLVEDKVREDSGTTQHVQTEATCVISPGKKIVSPEKMVTRSQKLPSSLESDRKNKRKQTISERADNSQSTESIVTIKEVEGVDEDDLTEYMDYGDEDDDFVDNQCSTTSKPRKRKNQASDDKSTHTGEEILAKLDGTEDTELKDRRKKSVNLSEAEDFPNLNKHGNSQSLQYKRSVKTNMTKSQTEFACDVCGKKYNKKYSLARHVKSHQPGVQQCGACHMFFENSDLLLAHKEKFHKKAIRCLMCTDSFSRNSCLRKHMMRAHPERCRTKFKCLYANCVAVFDAEDLYKDHLNIHKGLKPHVCNICGKSFPMRMYMRAHELRHAKEKKLGTQCDNCGKTFAGPGALHNHIMSVHNKRRYRCELCDRVFVYRAGYSKHVANHMIGKSDRAGKRNRNIKIRVNSSSGRAGVSNHNINNREITSPVGAGVSNHSINKKEISSPDGSGVSNHNINKTEITSPVGAGVSNHSINKKEISSPGGAGVSNHNINNREITSPVGAGVSNHSINKKKISSLGGAGVSNHINKREITSPVGAGVSNHSFNKKDISSPGGADVSNLNINKREISSPGGAGVSNLHINKREISSPGGAGVSNHNICKREISSPGGAGVSNLNINNREISSPCGAGVSNLNINKREISSPGGAGVINHNINKREISSPDKGDVSNHNINNSENSSLAGKKYWYLSRSSNLSDQQQPENTNLNKMGNHNINSWKNSAGKQYWYLSHSSYLSDQQKPENRGETNLNKIENSVKAFQSVDKNPTAIQGNIISGEITLTNNGNAFQEVEDRTKISVQEPKEFNTECAQSGSVIYTVAENGALSVQEQTPVNTGHLDTSGHLVWMFKS